MTLPDTEDGWTELERELRAHGRLRRSTWAERLLEAAELGVLVGVVLFFVGIALALMGLIAE